ncbi:MAG TPA: response regulator transcription factor [Thermoanaerobaculia bacterium]|jgi:two-component system alkaline phosphatase synthesis response regulator PhoP
MRRVLIVDDDPKVCETLDRYLAHAGYATATALDGAKALELARTFAPDLVVLDLMLPAIDGLAVCRALRETSSVPIIMLTAKSTERDKLAGLELGADDYLTKPFSPRELVARVEAVLRRAAKREQTPQIVAGALTIDPERCEVKVGDAPVTVTATELRLLTALARNPGRVYRRDELARLALGDDFDGLDRTIDAHIKNLRRKVGAELIATVFGIGYKLVA